MEFETFLARQPFSRGEERPDRDGPHGRSNGPKQPPRLSSVGVLMPRWRWPLPAAGADHDRLGRRHGEGRAGRRHSRRDGRRSSAKRAARRSTPVVTNATGDFVVRQRPAGHLHASRSRCRRSRRSKRSGIAVSPGDRMSARRADDRGRRHDRSGRRQGRGAAHPGAERRALVHGHDRGGREPADRQPQLHAARVARARRDRHRRPRRRPRIERRRRHQHHDGRRVDDGHRQQPAAAADERRVDRRSEGARPRATRPSTAGRAACRSRPSPRAAPTGSAARSTTSSAIPTGTPTARPTSSTAIPRPIAEARRDWGYSIGGPVGKPGGNNKLFFFYSQEFAPRTGGNDVVALPRADRARAQGDFSQTPDNNGNLVPVHQGSAASPAPAPRPNHDGLLRRRRRARQDSGEPALSDRPEHPEHVAAAEHHERAGRAGLQLRDHAARREHARAGSRRIRVDYQPTQTLRGERSSTRAGRSATQIDSTARFPASTTRRCRTRVVSTLGVTVNYTLTPDDVPRRHVRAQPERAGRLRAGAGRHRADVLPAPRSR